MKLVLDGIRVLDLSRMLAAPYCTLLLADMGAEVIRVERPEGEWDRTLGGCAAANGDTYAFICRNRNKKCITLDYGTPKGSEILKKLVALSDVLVESFATLKEKKAFGVDYETLKRVNSRIILASLSAFGNTGPYGSRVGVDGVAQALSSSMSSSGFPGNPPIRTHLSWVDYGTGIHMALGTLLALYHRDKTGAGQVVDVSILDTAINLTALYGLVDEYKVCGKKRIQMGNYSGSGYQDCIQTKDGWVLFTAIGPLWRRFLKVVGKRELAEDPRLKGEEELAQQSELIHRIVSPWFAERTTDEVLKLMLDARIPSGRVNDITGVMADPHVKYREMLVDIPHLPGTTATAGGVVIKLSETPGSIRRGAPVLGQHNAEIYGDLLGFNSKELAGLKGQGII